MPPHPAEELLEWLPALDFAVLEHLFAPHGRDYLVVVQDVLGSDPGTHELTFTHCVELEYQSRVRDEVWPTSWSDEFTDFARWVETGEPGGYVWGTNWSNAYPGISVMNDSARAGEWERRLRKPMFEMTLETDRFLLGLVFHSIRTRKLSDSTDTISQVHIPLDP